MRLKAKIILIIFLIFGATVLVLMSPVFSVKNIEIAGNEKYSDQQILSIAGIEPGMNIFKLIYSKSNQRLSEDNYIRFAECVTKLPDKLIINIIERKTCGYVPFMGAYLYIDQDGYVLENRPDMEGQCPLVSGLNFSEFTVGEPLEVENSDSFSVVMTMSRLLLNYDYILRVSEMKISNTDDIHLYVDNIDVSFGNINDADEKMRTMIEIINSIPEGEKGVLHFENPNIAPYLEHTL